MTTETQARPLFAARLTPHRSLSPGGIRIVVAVAAAILLVPGLTFLSLGAWPVVCFMVVVVLALYAALKWSFRDGRRAEQVTLWTNRLEIRRISPSGEEKLESFNPVFLRLRVTRDFDEHVTEITLHMREETTVIGAFLNPDDKATFAQAFGTALRKARNG
jgi:uncharacterized membrane protein